MAENDIVAMAESIANLINKHLETISSDMASLVNAAIVGRPEHGVTSAQLPVVFVAMDSYSEEINSLGTGAHRDNEMTVNLYPVIQYGIGFYDGSGQAEAEAEANRLTHNLVDLIRAYPDLSGTVDYVQGIDIEFNQEFGAESTYVKSNRIGIRCFKFIS